MTALTLPGTIPGLLRRGSPVILNSRALDVASHLIGRAGTLHQRIGDVCSVALDGTEAVALAPADVLDLDLADATGRAHAAWWLEEQSARWRGMQAGRRRDELLRLLECTERNAFHTKDEAEVRGRARMALSALRADDPRLLPDGSRWVDAEALRLVCLHVAGVAP